MPHRARNIGDWLRVHADEGGSRVAYSWLSDGETDVVEVSFSGLLEAAMEIAFHLRSIASPGDRVLLAYPTGPEFLAGFFGSLYAGVIPVPISVPRPNQSLAALEAIAADCDATTGLTTARVLTRLESRLTSSTSLSRCRWVTETEASGGRSGRLSLNPRQDAVAYLQYTSGSTGTPKGVIVTHAALMHNLEMIRTATEPSDAPVYVSWLPLFHDLGLVAVALESLYRGAHCVLLSPPHVLQKPWRWLRAISRFGGTVSGAPTFAYDLCVQKTPAEEIDTLNLTSWTAAFVAAEPVRPSSLRRFAATFERVGFDPRAFYPCYGLAEATVFVTGGAHGVPPVTSHFSASSLDRGVVAPRPAGEIDTRELIGCGHPWLDQEVAIVDPESHRRCAADRVGEIWIRGASVASGYWNRARETALTFGAHLQDEGSGPFLRTGDLGFIQQGELFITGRLKDLIIIRGTNHYPQDIETTAEAANTALVAGGSAAFSMSIDDEEQLITVHEVHRHRQGESSLILSNVREAVAAEHGLRPHAVVLLRPGTMPRTTSGKIRRQTCRARLVAGVLDVLAADYGDPDCRNTDDTHRPI